MLSSHRYLRMFLPQTCSLTRDQREYASTHARSPLHTAMTPREQHHLPFFTHVAAASSGPQNKLARLLALLARNLPTHRTTLIGLVRSHLQPQDSCNEASWTLFFDATADAILFAVCG